MEEFVREICTELGIKRPRYISHNIGKFPTETTLAMYDTGIDTLYVTARDSVDSYFAVAHELRHAWQYQNHKEWFEGYKQSNELSVDEYNSQFVEVDANAYAMVVMEDLFDVTPTFQGLSAKVIELIENRADEIF